MHVLEDYCWTTNTRRTAFVVLHEKKSWTIVLLVFSITNNRSTLNTFLSVWCRHSGLVTGCPHISSLCVLPAGAFLSGGVPPNGVLWMIFRSPSTLIHHYWIATSDGELTQVITWNLDWEPCRQQHRDAVSEQRSITGPHGIRCY